MNVVRCKDGVEFAVIAPGGFEILCAITMAASMIDCDLTITSGTDGVHSGIGDPHHRGEAYDIRIHDVPDPQQLLSELQQFLSPDHFFVFIEDAGTDNAHVHAQVRRGTTYP